MEDRMTELEVKVAFQERLLAELDEVIRQLRDEVEQLGTDVGQLRQQGSMAPEDPDQKPPHY